LLVAVRERNVENVPFGVERVDIVGCASLKRNVSIEIRTDLNLDFGFNVLCI
jgi:hypothetical protein